MPKPVVIVGALDTKGEEFRFGVSRQVKHQGEDAGNPSKAREEDHGC